MMMTMMSAAHMRLHATAPAHVDELSGWSASAATLLDGGVLPLLDGDGDAGAGNVPLLAIKRVYQPSKIKRQRKHGFLSRIATKAGRNVIQRRKDKGRHLLSI